MNLNIFTEIRFENRLCQGRARCVVKTNRRAIAMMLISFVRLSVRLERVCTVSIRGLWRSVLSVRAPECIRLKNAGFSFRPVWR